MLVILLPMSGCFDGAVGDAEADDSEETTVINNYYYNNTTIVESESNEPEYFVVGGMVDNNTSMVERPNNYPPYYYPYNFSTTSGQTLYIHQLKSVSGSIVTLISDCGEGGVWTTSSTQADNGYWVAGSSFDCEHSVRLIPSSNGILGIPVYPPPYYFSMIYSIENMSVIAL